MTKIHYKIYQIDYRSIKMPEIKNRQL